MSSDHPALSMTLREAFEAYYEKDRISARALKHHRTMIGRWERFHNPPIGEITSENMEWLRRQMLETGLAASSVNSSRTTYRAILRRLGPAVTGNPMGLGILSEIPWMRHCQEIRSRPKRVSLDDLSRFYLACKCISRTVNGVSGMYWFQALVVVAYLTGLRKSDLFGIRTENVDLERGELWHQSVKTMKGDIFPLHPCAVEHIRRIWKPNRERLFQTQMHTGGDLTHRWNRILRASGVERFTLHDIRRTAASEIEYIKPGMGAVFLQHVDRSVTGMFYLNRTHDLRECIEKMRVPIAFAHGPKQAERAMERARREIERMTEFAKASAVAIPSTPAPEEWNFFPGGFQIRGYNGQLTGAPWRALQVLALSKTQPVDMDTLAAVVYIEGTKRPTERERIGQGVSSVVSTIRERLRRTLCLPDNYDPCYCVERGHGGKWQLMIPTQLSRDGAA